MRTKIDFNKIKFSKSKISSGIRYVLGKYSIYIAFVLLCIVLSYLSPAFLTVSNALNVLRQVTIIGIIAIGTTFVLLSGGIDLSSGSIVALSGVLGAVFASPYGITNWSAGFLQKIGTDETVVSGALPIIVPIIVALGIGAFCGLINGIIIAKGKVPAFIVTLGMMTVARGVALLISGGGTVPYVTDEFKSLGGSYILGIPSLAFFFITVLVIASFVLYKTRFGRHIYAIGGNETAALISGVNVDKVKITVYVIAGTLAGLGGLLLASRIACGSPVAGQGYELDAIAACVIGGTSTIGGSGRLLGTVVGVLIIGVMSNGLDMIGVASYYQSILKGIIIVLAVYYDMRSKNRALA